MAKEISISIVSDKAQQRFWAKVQKTDTCWLWPGAKSKDGFGVTKLNGRVFFVHRLVYEIHNGRIPDGFTIRHTCKVINCVKPDHLYLSQRGDWNRTGRYPSPEERFWARVQKTDSCWLWTGQKNISGYGIFSVKGQGMRTHRFIYEIEFGPIPEGLLVCHHCDNRICVNPSHLFLGTAADNVHDMIRKGRRASPILYLLNQ